MRYVRIENEIVTNIIDLDHEPVFDTAERGFWRPVAEGHAVQYGWILDEAGEIVPPPVLPGLPVAAPSRLAKADLWRRLSDEEAETLDVALQQAPIRLRRIFEAAQYLDTADDDYQALRAGIVAALGADSADEVLAPTYCPSRTATASRPAFLGGFFLSGEHHDES